MPIWNQLAAIKFVQDKNEIDEAKFNEECGVGMFNGSKTVDKDRIFFVFNG